MQTFIFASFLLISFSLVICRGRESRPPRNTDARSCIGIVYGPMKAPFSQEAFWQFIGLQNLCNRNIRAIVDCYSPSNGQTMGGYRYNLEPNYEFGPLQQHHFTIKCTDPTQFFCNVIKLAKCQVNAAAFVEDKANVGAEKKPEAANVTMEKNRKWCEDAYRGYESEKHPNAWITRTTKDPQWRDEHGKIVVVDQLLPATLGPDGKACTDCGFSGHWVDANGKVVNYHTVGIDNSWVMACLKKMECRQQRCGESYALSTGMKDVE